MSLITFFTSLISIGATYFDEIMSGICLPIDGIIYTIVSGAFKLFLLMCQLNFNSLYAIVSPLIDRLQAVVLVFIVFKLGLSLIQYMLDPDSAPKKGKEFVINLFITAALLISYNFIFSVFNELNMLIVGVPENYHFVTLSEIANVTDEADSGLIMRFVFGETNEIPDIGDYIAYETLSIFVKDTTNETTLKNAISESGGYNFKKLSTLTSKVGKTIDYTYLVSGIMGIYLIYSIVKISIEIGIRMFKLLLLQILAPIAIINIIDGGVKGKFNDYVKAYLSTFTSAFVRILSMLIITVFVGKFFGNLGDFYSENIADTGKVFGTQGLLSILIIVAAYKFAVDVPKFIDSILGTKLADGDSKGGFGKFMGNALGLGAGVLSGGIGGLASGIASKAGVGGTLANMGLGMFNGGSSGLKGNTIQEKMKNLSAAQGKNTARAQDWGRRGFNNVIGGALGTAFGVKSRQDQQMYQYDQQDKALSAYDAAQVEAIKDLKSTDSAFTWGSSSSAADYAAGYENIKLGESKDSYASKMADLDNGYLASKSAYDAAVKTGNQRSIKSALTRMASAREAAVKKAGDIYDVNKNSASNDNITAKRADLGKAMGGDNNITYKTSQSTGRYVDANGVELHDQNDASARVVDGKKTGQGITANKHAMENNKSYRQTHGASKDK